MRDTAAGNPKPEGGFVADVPNVVGKELSFVVVTGGGTVVAKSKHSSGDVRVWRAGICCCALIQKRPQCPDPLKK